MAPRPKTIELSTRVALAGLVALALLALGEQAPAAFPVHVTLEAHGAAVSVSVDGQTHSVDSALGGGWRSLLFEQPGPVEREYQIDGSDTTSTDDRNSAFIIGLLSTPLYRVDSWLRDEGSYSRWENLSIVNLASAGAPVSADGPLPPEFRVDVDLRRPEAAARLWLIGASSDQREGLELDRDMRNARWVIRQGASTRTLPRWFFPEQPMPFVAELLQLLGRSAAAAYALALMALAMARALAFITGAKNSSLETEAKPGLLRRREPPWRAWAGVVLAIWLGASAFVSVSAYHQLPHILDAVSYTFQAGLFASGQLSLRMPALTSAFLGPFQVVSQGRMFSQYPPGAPALYAVGKLLDVEWLVGPLACLGLIAATAWTARVLYGNATGLVVLGFGVISPFVLFQSGSYLSHPVAGGLVAGALATFVAGERREQIGWFAATGALLGAAFLVREVAAVLFAVPLGVQLLARRRWRALAHVVAFGLPFLLAYLLYNLRQTGSPLLLPRALFDASDHFGFGDGIGFHTRHTLAAGLANTDELLTLLQFDVFGWPPLFAFGLLGLPILTGRAVAWDWMAAGGFLAFVAAYVGYFYHGIALGPRYYFEAMPWLLLMAGRGVQVLAHIARSRVAPALIVGALTLNTLLFYAPAELQRRMDLSGLPGGVKLSLGFVKPSLFGPQLTGLPPDSLVVTSDWWTYNAALSALNCPREPDCEVLFALAPTDEDANRLRAQFPDRTLLRAVDEGGTLEAVPY